MTSRSRGDDGADGALAALSSRVRALEDAVERVCRQIKHACQPIPEEHGSDRLGARGEFVCSRGADSGALSDEFVRYLHGLRPNTRRSVLRQYRRAQVELERQRADASDRLRRREDASVRAETMHEIYLHHFSLVTRLFFVADLRPAARELASVFHEDFVELDRHARAEGEDVSVATICRMQATLARDLSNSLKAVAEAPSPEDARAALGLALSELLKNVFCASRMRAEARSREWEARDSVRDTARLVCDAAAVRALRGCAPGVRSHRRTARSPHAQRRRAASSSESSGTDPGDPEPAPRSPGHVAGLLLAGGRQ